MPNTIIPVQQLCPESDFQNSNDLINIGIIVDIFITDINYRIYKEGSDINKDLIKSDPLVLLARSYSSDFDLKVHKVSDNKNSFDIEILLQERFKFASSEFIHKYLKNKGLDINPDHLSDLFIAFRNQGFIKKVEDEIITSQLNTTREKLRKNKNYYQILGNAFFAWKETPRNQLRLIEKVQNDYQNEFKLFKKDNLIEVIDSALTYHTEKRIFARLVQNAIDNDAHKYFKLFENIFTDKEGKPDTEENNILKAQVCAAASFYERNIDKYAELIHQEYPNFKKEKIIGLDDFGSTLIIEAIRESYKDQHGMVPNVGRTIKINNFVNLRRGLNKIQRDKLIAHNKRSFDISCKADGDSSYKTYEFVGLEHALKLLDRRFLTQGEDFINFLLTEIKKNIPSKFDDSEYLKLDENKKYTYQLMTARWNYFKDRYTSAQIPHNRFNCKKIVQ